MTNYDDLMFQESDVDPLFELLKIQSDDDTFFEDSKNEVKSRIAGLVAVMPDGVRAEDISMNEPWVERGLRLHIAEVFMRSEAFLVHGDSPFEFLELFIEANKALYEAALVNTVYLASALAMCAEMLPTARIMTSSTDVVWEKLLEGND